MLPLVLILTFLLEPFQKVSLALGDPVRKNRVIIVDMSDVRVRYKTADVFIDNGILSIKKLPSHL